MNGDDSPTSKDHTFEIGVISDTHGTLSPLVSEIFKETDLIIHAGDIDKEDVLKKLRKISPVTAVKGNVDFGEWAQNLKAAETIEVGEISIYILHNLEKLDLAPAGIFNVVIYGHTHLPSAEMQNNVLFLNPGSATYPPAKTSASVALIYINGLDIDVKFIEIT
ncbi:uncharacterized protein BuS5_02121 [Desulfosarcina sp. BuS5]|uniref:metallophosphoesterase family protein n=1 Tax=Desulfosarcina sp. BuS5 TaxID=933262 RepID=UPI00055998FF|nr:metallophosphoesterase family protein [Desulfosarcina sp. BuS5]WDN89153.1 uncharacterized protein BuS5_02121 [Desulfosarcina sp. BuS5]